MDFCAYLKQIFQATNSINEFKATPKFNNTEDLVTNSQHLKKIKSFSEKSRIRIKWLLRPVRNFISNFNLSQRWYLFGWLMFSSAFLMILAIYEPFILVLLVTLIAIFIIIKNKSYLIAFFKIFQRWIKFEKILKIICAISVFVLIAYFLFRNYPQFTLIDYFNFLTFIGYTVIVAFSIGFIIDSYYIWQKYNTLFNKIVKILGVISSFVSLYISRWIVIDFTGLEPATFSRALIFFSIPVGIIFWLCISILVCGAIYFLTLLLQFSTMIFTYLFLIFDPLNHPWYRFWFRKPLKFNTTDKLKKFWFKLFFVYGSRALGAGLLAASIVWSFQPILPIFVANFNSLTDVAETAIVWLDYRPKNKLTECTNLEEGEWGLLVGQNKVSVAKPQILGGYSFTTKSCLFNDARSQAKSHTTL